MRSHLPGFDNGTHTHTFNSQCDEDSTWHMDAVGDLMVNYPRSEQGTTQNTPWTRPTHVLRLLSSFCMIDTYCSIWKNPCGNICIHIFGHPWVDRLIFNKTLQKSECDWKFHILSTPGWYNIYIYTNVWRVHLTTGDAWRWCWRRCHAGGGWLRFTLVIHFWLVVWNIHFIFPYIGNLIIPID